MKLLILGNNQAGHVGRFFVEAADKSGHEVRLMDVGAAMDGPVWPRRLLWRLAHRPLRLRSFSRRVVDLVQEWQPEVVLTTGQCPVNAQSLAMIRVCGAKLVNYSTDDPWSPVHRAAWFLKALPHYDHVFSTRRANIKDFFHSGCQGVSWLPFAYEPTIHYPEPDASPEWESDVAFVGGADQDRVPVISKLVRAGHRVSLWGGYWERFSQTKCFSRGMADSHTLRKVVSNTRCALTLVRRANRDGHSMRTYEVAAMGGPALAEDTREHREILGHEGDSALYFSSDDELIEKCRWLVEHPKDGAELGTRLAQRIRAGKNTYLDRLQQMEAVL
jgi:spore maturation protein CgeB